MNTLSKQKLEAIFKDSTGQKTRFEFPNWPGALGYHWPPDGARINGVEFVGIKGAASSELLKWIKDCEALVEPTPDGRRLDLALELLEQVERWPTGLGGSRHIEHYCPFCKADENTKGAIIHRHNCKLAALLNKPTSPAPEPTVEWVKSLSVPGGVNIHFRMSDGEFLVLAIKKEYPSLARRIADAIEAGKEPKK